VQVPSKKRYDELIERRECLLLKFLKCRKKDYIDTQEIIPLGAGRRSLLRLTIHLTREEQFEIVLGLVMKLLKQFNL
jgi:hypothetical protein